MIIQLSEDWRIASDPLQWILQKRTPNGRWTNVGYFGDLERAVLQAASALTHSEGTGMRLILARMISAGLVQRKGLGFSLCSWM